MPSLQDDLKELTDLSQLAGRRADWAQGAGGNASLKRDSLLLVKASGLRLDETSPARGFVALDLAAAREVLDDPSYGDLPHGAQQDAAAEALARALRPLAGLEAEGLRPSLEAEFHALGPRVCLHAHLVEALAALCLEEAQEALAAILPEGGWVWADYRPPGHSLACLLRDALRREEAPLALMRNHGVVAWGDSAAQALARMERLQQACAAHFRPAEPPQLRAKSSEAAAALKAAAAAAREAWPHLAERGAAAEPWSASPAAAGAWSWQPVCPDDVVYCGAQVPVLEASEAARPEALQRRLGPAPAVACLALGDHGLLIAAKDRRAWRAAAELLAANARARALARSRGHVRPLSREQGLELLGMKTEQRRQAQ